MPLVVVEIIGGESPTPPDLARQLADAFGEIFGSASGETWVRIHALPRAAYAENGVAQPIGANAVFVAITKRALPPPAALAAEAARVSRVVAQICARATDHVHVIYEPPGAGRIAFGGRLVP